MSEAKVLAGLVSTGGCGCHLSPHQYPYLLFQGHPPPWIGATSYHDDLFKGVSSYIAMP